MKHRSLKKRLLALATTVLTLVMCMAGTMSASAEDTNIAPTENLITSFKKYLVMDENANVPDADFTFTITAGSAVEAVGSRVIYAGNDPTRVTGFPVLKVDNTGTTATVTVSFNPGDQIYNTKEDGDTVSLGSGQKYAKKTVTVDFTDVDFNAPGIYRYIITETENTQDGITNDTTATRTLDVFVEYDEAETAAAGQLKVSSYILYPGTKIDAADVTESLKDDGFTNTYATYDLTLTKQVTGNQGDRDKYFEFTVTISNAVNGTVYTVDLPDVDNDSRNLDTLTATNGTVVGTYYLKDGQSIVIQGLTSDTNYTITETSYTDDGYTTSYVLDSASSVTANTTNEQTMNGANHTVTFTNNKQGTVPTGVLLETAPYIILGVVVIAGFVVLFATRRRHSR